MKVNQSTTERIARVATGLLMLKNSKGVKSKILALVPLVTGATGYCPAKSKLLGIDDVKGCSKKQNTDDKAAKKEAEQEQEKAEALKAKERKDEKQKEEAEQKEKSDDESTAKPALA